jgi:hypothetical protein
MGWNDWSVLAQDGERRRAVVITLMNLWGVIKCR